MPRRALSALAVVAAVALLLGVFGGLAVAQEEPPFVRGEPELDVTFRTRPCRRERRRS